MVDPTFDVNNFSYPLKSGVNGYVDSIGSIMGEKFPAFYVGKASDEQDIPFMNFSNGTLIPTGHYRVFGAALAYPKDIISSQVADFNTFLSTDFHYKLEKAIRNYQHPGIHIYGSLMGYNSYSNTLISPYDTIYVYLSLHASYGINKNDVASINLPNELGGFQNQFKVQSKAGIDVGLVSINQTTNVLTVHFLENINGMDVRANIGIYGHLKNPATFSPGRYFFKFTSLGENQFRYLRFIKGDSTVPRVGCRTDGKNGWLDVDIPENTGAWSRAVICAATTSGALFDSAQIRVIESSALDSFGNVTSYNELSDSKYLVSQETASTSVDLQSATLSDGQVLRISFPFLYGNSGKATGAVARVQLFSENNDTTYSLNCKFDSSGSVGNTFTFSWKPLYFS